MKYKVTQIKEDNRILKLNDYQIAKLVKCSPAYINHLRTGRRIATEAFYNKLKRSLKKA